MKPSTASTTSLDPLDQQYPRSKRTRHHKAHEHPGKTHRRPQEQVMNHRFVGGSAGYVHLTVRDSRHVGGSAGWVEAW